MARLIFITGASSGIGQALAERCHAEGWHLALVARRADDLRAWAQARGWSAERWRVYPADVADIDSIVAAGQACLAQQGVPDVGVANAGISVGMAATFQPFVAAMRQRGSGTLVGIASVAAIRGLPGHGAYCASKAGVVAYCESLRGELRGSGVRVVTLLPGYVDTPLTRKNRYPMPFLLSADRFAQRALRAIEQGVSYRVIPWQMALVAKLLRVLPNAWFDRLLSGRPRKARAGQGSATGS